MSKRKTLKQKKAKEKQVEKIESSTLGASKSIWTTDERLTRFGLSITETRLLKLKAKRKRQLQSLVAKSEGNQKKNYERRLSQHS